MLQFRARLHVYIDNEQWESVLEQNNVYDDERIVFFGDSQIDLWWMSPYFGSLPIINRGISGDWATKAVDRFDNDALAPKPRTVLILIGTNDIGHAQPIDAISDSIHTMVEKAVNSNANVILCSILPVAGKFIDNHSLNDVLELNRCIKKISDEHENTLFVDLFTPLSDEHGMFRKELTRDGLHPNKSGYMVMSKAVMPHLVSSQLAQSN